MFDENITMNQKKKRERERITVLYTYMSFFLGNKMGQKTKTEQTKRTTQEPNARQKKNMSMNSNLPQRFGYPKTSNVSMALNKIRKFVLSYAIPFIPCMKKRKNWCERRRKKKWKIISHWTLNTKRVRIFILQFGTFFGSLFCFRRCGCWLLFV